MPTKTSRRNFESLESRRLLAADFVAADFNADRAVDASDIDLLIAEVRNGGTDTAYDLTQDGAISQLDVDYLIETLLDTRYGDVDLDGDVEFSDFLVLSNNFSQAGTWSHGNFGSSSNVDFADFLLLSHNFNYKSSRLIYTHQSMDGNRYVSGWGAIADVTPIDIQLDFEPAWVLGVEHVEDGERRDIWVAVSAQGEQKGVFLSNDGSVQEFSVNSLPPGVPPALAYSKQNPNIVSMLSSPDETAANVPTHPVLSADSSQLAYLNSDANLVLSNGGRTETVPINALLDSRILSDGEGRLLVLTDPTTIYPHGIFGDIVEASSFTIVDTSVSPAAVTKVSVPEGRVIESLIPTWVDVDNDGEREIIVTISDRARGAQVTVYNERGEVEMEGEGIGRGFRWRHQLAVAPFGPHGEVEFVDVLTPHIGGVVEFRSLEADTLPIIASVPGYTSHVNRTPNIDMAAAGDFDSDGVVELILPNQRRTTLGAITRTATATGAELDWEVQIGATLTTNVGVLRTSTGQLSIAVGRDDGVLRIWRSSAS